MSDSHPSSARHRGCRPHPGGTGAAKPAERMPSSPHREVADEQDVDVALQPQISAVVAVIAERHELGLDGLLGEVLPRWAWTQRSETAPSPSARRSDRRFEYGSMRRSLRWIMRTRSRARRRGCGSPDACGNRKASVCQRTTGGRSRSGIAATALSGWRYQVAVPRSQSNRSGRRFEPRASRRTGRRSRGREGHP